MTSERMEQIKVVLQAMENAAPPPCQECDGAYDALAARHEVLVAEMQKIEAELRTWHQCQACREADAAQEAKRQALVAEWQQLDGEGGGDGKRSWN